MTDSSISLNKYISSTGICSRREADKMIEAGRVMLNGSMAKKGNRVNPGDEVKVDGHLIGVKPPQIYIMLNKPPGITCTTDIGDPDNIIDFVGYPERIFPIGRLDKASSGLILLTNDGDIVNEILRKENKHQKEYVVTVDRPITKQFLQEMSRPIPMLGTRTLPSEVIKINAHTFKIVLTQGLNRQIRRMCTYCGYEVRTLKRIRIMHLKLDNLRVGHWRKLTKKEVALLRATKK